MAVSYDQQALLKRSDAFHSHTNWRASRLRSTTCSTGRAISEPLTPEGHSEAVNTSAL
jgi:hypothetical protein